MSTTATEDKETKEAKAAAKAEADAQKEAEEKEAKELAEQEKAIGKVTAPEGLSKDEEKAWKMSLPKPARQREDNPSQEERLASMEARIVNLEKLLNVDLGTGANPTPGSETGLVVA